MVESSLPYQHMCVANCQKLFTISVYVAEIKAAEIDNVKNVKCSAAIPLLN